MAAASQALIGEFFQLGYVTRDLDRALALYRDRYGCPEFLRFDTRDLSEPGATGPFMQVALAWKGPAMVELIQPDADDPSIYGDALRDDGGVNLHHLGYFVDEARFASLEGDFLAQGYKVPVLRTGSNGISYMYADTRSDTGLFSEFIALGASGRDFFETIPRN